MNYCAMSGALGLADVDAAHPIPVQRLIGQLCHASLTSASPHLLACEVVPPGEPGAERKKLTRVLERNSERPLGRPAPGVRLTCGLNRTKKQTTSRAVPPPFSTPVRRRASGTEG